MRINAPATLAAFCLAAGCSPAEEPRAALEAPAAATGAQAAAEVARRYFAAIGARRYGEAWRLLDEDARPVGASEADFAAAFDKYAEYHAEVGAPGPIEGAAGSLHVPVPVRVRGRMKNGETFDSSGTVWLSRCNHVPGCTAGQRQWRVTAENIGLGAPPPGERLRPRR